MHRPVVVFTALLAAAPAFSQEEPATSTPLPAAPAAQEDASAAQEDAPAAGEHAQALPDGAPADRHDAPAASPARDEGAPAPKTPRLFRVGAGLTSERTSVGGGLLVLSPALTLLAEGCPLESLCVLGHAAASLGRGGGAGGFAPGFPPGTQPSDVKRDLSQYNISASGGARYIVTPGAPVELSGFVIVGGSWSYYQLDQTATYADGEHKSQSVTTQTSVFGTVGVAFERELLEDVRLRLSSTIANVSWSSYRSETSVDADEPSVHEDSGLEGGLSLRPALSVLIAF